MLNLFVPNIELTLSFPIKNHVVFCKSLLRNKIEKYFLDTFWTQVSEELKVSYYQKIVTSQNAISLQQNLIYINLVYCLKVPTQMQFYL
jgi:hypothetical protein